MVLPPGFIPSCQPPAIVPEVAAAGLMDLAGLRGFGFSFRDAGVLLARSRVAAVRLPLARTVASPAQISKHWNR